MPTGFGLDAFPYRSPMYTSGRDERFPVNRAYLHDLNISTTRAYTAIEAG